MLRVDLELEARLRDKLYRPEINEEDNSIEPEVKPYSSVGNAIE